MKSFLFATAGAFTVAFCAPALAATDGTGSQTSQTVAISPAAVAPGGTRLVAARGPADPNQIICKTVDVTGSHLGSTRTCRTRAVWDELTRASREEVDKVQSDRSYSNRQ